MEQTNLNRLKQDLIEEINQRVADRILEPNNADLLCKLIRQADNENEAIAIAALGTTYKRTGLHFDKRFERMTDDISYFRRNTELSFHTDDHKPIHKLIVGDNYEALQNLLIQYRGAVDVIYIDPPYGKDSMGEFAQTNYANAISRDNLLSMLYPRLMFAKQLLSDSGVIFCSIDDKNQAYVKCLFDEVFGEKNFITIFPRLTKKAGKTTDTIAINHDYVITYAGNEKVAFKLLEHIDNEYKHIDEYEKERGKYKLSQTLDYDTLGYVPSLDYPITIDGITYYAGGVDKAGYKKRKQDNPKNGYRWRWSKELFDFGYENGFIVVKNTLNGSRIYTKTYKNAVIEKKGMFYEVIFKERKKIPSSLTLLDNIYSNDNAKKELDSIFTQNVFDYSKPTALIKTLANLCDNPDAIVLDFFAGSGTTGHAVLDLNKQDGGNRTFILCQLNETTDTTPNGIAYDVTAKRLKRIMTGSCYDDTTDFKWAQSNTPYGGNLDVYEIDHVPSFEYTEGKSPFEVIDETIYGQKRFATLREKIEWVCTRFANTQKRVENDHEWTQRTQE